MMEALDGNAIGGRLLTAFGIEMTTASGVCATCGEMSYLAELEVYVEAPGAVGRCRKCGSVLVVLVEAHGRTWADVRGLARLDMPLSLSSPSR
jgi:Family of unknown function (DUF6510)